MRTALRHRAAKAPVFQAHISFAVPAPAAPAERPLSGHSGARIVLYSDGRDSFVRKTAADRAASARLKAQADKQQSFWMLGLPFPRVRAQARDAAGIGSFDMNYIPGRTIADAVLNGATFDPAAVVKAVERLMGLFILTTGGELPPGLFEEKIHGVANRLAGTAKNPGLLDAFRTCARLLTACDWRGIPHSPCHGDLTLENILLTTGKSIAFIDCDVPFASSYWLDFGKLFQDIDGHWCIRTLHEPDGNGIHRLNAVQKLDVLGARLRQLAASLDDRLASRLPQLAALGLFRAIPYARNDAVRAFLCQRIAHVLES